MTQEDMSDTACQNIGHPWHLSICQNDYEAQQILGRNFGAQVLI